VVAHTHALLFTTDLELNPLLCLVPLGLITAKVPYLLWPMKRFGPVDIGPEQKGRVRKIKQKALDV
jgi:hypothetical protein